MYLEQVAKKYKNKKAGTLGVFLILGEMHHRYILVSDESFVDILC